MYLFNVLKLKKPGSADLCRLTLEFTERNIPQRRIARLISFDHGFIVLFVNKTINNLTDFRKLGIFKQRNIAAAVADKKPYCLDIKADTDVKKLLRSF